MYHDPLATSMAMHEVIRAVLDEMRLNNNYGAISIISGAVRSATLAQPSSTFTQAPSAAGDRSDARGSGTPDAKPVSEAVSPSSAPSSSWVGGSSGLGSSSAARRSTSSTLSLTPTQVLRLMLLRCELYSATQQHDLALQDAMVAVELSSGLSAEAYVVMGRELLHLFRVAEAVSAFETADALLSTATAPIVAAVAAYNAILASRGQRGGSCSTLSTASTEGVRGQVSEAGPNANSRIPDLFEPTVSPPAAALEATPNSMASPLPPLIASSTPVCACDTSFPAAAEDPTDAAVPYSPEATEAALVRSYYATSIIKDISDADFFALRGVHPMELSDKERRVRRRAVEAEEATAAAVQLGLLTRQGRPTASLVEMCQRFAPSSSSRGCSSSRSVAATETRAAGEPAAPTSTLPPGTSNDNSVASSCCSFWQFVGPTCSTPELERWRRYAQEARWLHLMHKTHVVPHAVQASTLQMLSKQVTTTRNGTILAFENNTSHPLVLRRFHLVHSAVAHGISPPETIDVGSAGFCVVQPKGWRSFSGLCCYEIGRDADARSGSTTTGGSSSSTSTDMASSGVLVFFFFECSFMGSLKGGVYACDVDSDEAYFILRTRNLRHSGHPYSASNCQMLEAPSLPSGPAAGDSADTSSTRIPAVNAWVTTKTITKRMRPQHMQRATAAPSGGIMGMNEAGLHTSSSSPSLSSSSSTTPSLMVPNDPWGSVAQPKVILRQPVQTHLTFKVVVDGGSGGGPATHDGASSTSSSATTAVNPMSLLPGSSSVDLIALGGGGVAGGSPPSIGLGSGGVTASGSLAASAGVAGVPLPDRALRFSVAEVLPPILRSVELLTALELAGPPVLKKFAAVSHRHRTLVNNLPPTLFYNGVGYPRPPPAHPPGSGAQTLSNPPHGSSMAPAGARHVDSGHATTAAKAQGPTSSSSTSTATSLFSFLSGTGGITPNYTAPVTTSTPASASASAPPSINTMIALRLNQQHIAKVRRLAYPDYCLDMDRELSPFTVHDKEPIIWKLLFEGHGPESEEFCFVDEYDYTMSNGGDGGGGVPSMRLRGAPSGVGSGSGGGAAVLHDGWGGGNGSGGGGAGCHSRGCSDTSAAYNGVRSARHVHDAIFWLSCSTTSKTSVALFYGDTRSPLVQVRESWVPFSPTVFFVTPSGLTFASCFFNSQSNLCVAWGEAGSSSRPEDIAYVMSRRARHAPHGATRPIVGSIASTVPAGTATVSGVVRGSSATKAIVVGGEGGVKGVVLSVGSVAHHTSAAQSGEHATGGARKLDALPSASPLSLGDGGSGTNGHNVRSGSTADRFESLNGEHFVVTKKSAEGALAAEVVFPVVPRRGLRRGTVVAEVRMHREVDAVLLSLLVFCRRRLG